MRTPSDAPLRMTYLHMKHLLRGPAEGESGRAHLVGTTSGSDHLYHAISSGRLIVINFFPKSFYVGLVWYDKFYYANNWG